jgi:hypothetical protein
MFGDCDKPRSGLDPFHPVHGVRQQYIRAAGKFLAALLEDQADVLADQFFADLELLG